MPNNSITIPNIDYLRGSDPRLAEAFDAVARYFQNVSLQTGADPTQNQSQAPSQVQGLQVTASGGIYEVKINDTTPVAKQINYFAEYSTTPGFQKPTVVPMGPSRNVRLNLGNQNFYWRAYSQYPTSNPSDPVYFGSKSSPTSVSGGGSTIGPVPLASSGSGTASNDGTQGGSGFGTIPIRSSPGASGGQDKGL